MTADPATVAVERFARELPRNRPVYLAIGVFDGVHRGHQAILTQLVADARADDAFSCVMTFDPHPLSVLRPGWRPQLLMAVADRIALLHAHGVERVLVVPFTRAFARMEPEAFVRDILAERMRVQRAYVGYSFTFGRGARGTPALMRETGRPYGLDVREVGAVTIERDVPSSTVIRRALEDGRVDAAARVLGRPHVVQGPVQRGDARGRTLGFPTANLSEGGPVLWPGNGVYAVAVCTAGVMYGGVANLGRRPTVTADGPRLLEVHLFDFEGDLYGRTLRVAFLERLREERRFPDLDSLRAQIRRDVAQARAALAEAPLAASRAYLCRGLD